MQIEPVSYNKYNPDRVRFRAFSMNFTQIDVFTVGDPGRVRFSIFTIYYLDRVRFLRYRINNEYYSAMCDSVCV